MDTMQVLVTPELAAEWLRLNTRNRGLVSSRVDEFVAAMKTGRFIPTHQGIARGSDGTLYDGQHRLAAVVKAGIPVLMLVTTNVPPEAMSVIDTGLSRRAHDILKIADGKTTSVTLRATVFAAQEIVNGGLATGGKRATVDALREALFAFETDANVILDIIGRRHDRLGQAPMLGALTLIRRVFPEEAVAFCRDVASGVGLTERHAALALRNYVLLHYNVKTSGARTDLALRTFNAFAAYQTGTPRKFVKTGEAQQARIVQMWLDKATEPTDPSVADTAKRKAKA